VLTGRRWNGNPLLTTEGLLEEEEEEGRIADVLDEPLFCRLLLLLPLFLFCLLDLSRVRGERGAMVKGNEGSSNDIFIEGGDQ